MRKGKSALGLLATAVLMIFATSSPAQLGKPINLNGNNGIFYNQGELKEIATKLDEVEFLKEDRMLSTQELSLCNNKLTEKYSIISSYEAEVRKLDNIIVLHRKNNSSVERELNNTRDDLRKQVRKKNTIIVVGGIVLIAAIIF